MGLSSIAHVDELDHGAAVILHSRFIRRRCEATGLKSRQLALDFLLTHPFRAVRDMRGASDIVNSRAERPREVWRHRPTGQRWVVTTDMMGVPESAAGPFGLNEWDPVLRDYVLLDGHHSLAWLREHIDEFARDDDGQP